MKPIIDEMDRLSAQAASFALATVISRNGSAPRSAGAKMLVKEDGASIGTVGGGILEAQVQRLAAQMIQEHRAVIQRFEFSGKDVAAMDAICGGQVEVLVEWIDGSDPLIVAVLGGMRDAITLHEKGWLVTVFSSSTGSTTHVLIRQDGSIHGTLPIGIDLETIQAARVPVRMDLELRQVMIEPLNIAGTAYIFGAGHVSRSLAEFVKAVGFWTVVLDDRAEYANPERFPGADELVVLDSFSGVGGMIPIDRDSYLVIVTRGHLNDLVVLAQVLKSNACYIGMIGSRRKCELVFEELRRMGHQEEDIRRVQAPIGLPIEAETPEEIGISIVAEMIQARARQRKRA